MTSEILFAKRVGQKQIVQGLHHNPLKSWWNSFKRKKKSMNSVIQLSQEIGAASVDEL